MLNARYKVKVFNWQRVSRQNMMNENAWDQLVLADTVRGSVDMVIGD